MTGDRPPADQAVRSSSAPDRPPLDVKLGDRLTLAKPHPCGARTWTVVRLGADIGLLCDGCGHRVLLERRQLERRFRGFLEPDGERSEH